MGWQDYHLHEFEIGAQRYGIPDTDYDLPGEVVKDSTVKLSKALPRKGASLLYTHDFGDGWAHSVVLEDIAPVEPGTKYARVVDGARSCPPEDFGGPYGYADLLEILAKPRHKEPPNARLGRKGFRSREVFSAGDQSPAQTKRSKACRHLICLRSERQIAPGDSNVGFTPSNGILSPEGMLSGTKSEVP